MSERVVTDLDEHGRVLTRKRSRAELERVLLIHEADVLALARHPGVVDLVGVESEDDQALLATVFVGTHSLDTVEPFTVEQAAATIASLAETVADLHQRGLVHGRIDPSHVLIGTGGRPVLCGFAGGGRIGTTPPPGSTAACPGFIDPAASSEAALTPQRDVYALGALLRSLIGEGGTELEPIPERRIGFTKPKGPWTGYQRRALLTLADRATDDAPLRRPPARRFAADIRSTIPGAQLDNQSGDPYATLRMAPDEPTPGHGTRRAGLIAIGAGLVLVVVGTMGLPGAGSSAPISAPSAVPNAPARAPRTTSSMSTPVTHGARCAATGLPVADDLDRDGCGDPLGIEGDRQITVGTRRFSVGNEGDRVRVGDWNCDGYASVAVLRPSTGSVFVFDSWATEGNDVSVSPRATVPGAVDIAVRDTGEGCSTLVAIRADGTEEGIT